MPAVASPKPVRPKLATVRGVEIFACGRHREKDYTEADLVAMVENFSACKGMVDPPLVIGHEESQPLLNGLDPMDNTGTPAVGKVTRVWKQGKTLFADFSEVPPQIARLINQRAYRRVSSEIYDEPPDGLQGKARGKMLRRVALLGGELPQIKTLADLPLAEFSEKSSQRATLRPSGCRNLGRGVWAVFSEVTKLCQEGENAGLPGPCPTGGSKYGKVNRAGTPNARGEGGQQPSQRTLEDNARRVRAELGPAKTAKTRKPKAVVEDHPEANRIAEELHAQHKARAKGLTDPLEFQASYQRYEKELKDAGIVGTDVGYGFVKARQHAEGSPMDRQGMIDYLSQMGITIADTVTDEVLQSMVQALQAGAAAPEGGDAPPPDMAAADQPDPDDEDKLRRTAEAMSGSDELRGSNKAAQIRAIWAKDPEGDYHPDAKHAEGGQQVRVAATGAAPPGNGSTSRALVPSPVPSPVPHPTQITMKYSETTKQLAALEARQRELEKFAEKQLDAAKRATVKAELDALVQAGKVFPAERDAGLDDVLHATDSTTVHKFSEGGKGKYVEQTAFDRLLGTLKKRPVLMSFAERMKQPAGKAGSHDADAELAKVQRFSEDPKFSRALEATGQTPAEYVEKFSELKKKAPSLTAAKYGVPESV